MNRRGFGSFVIIIVIVLAVLVIGGIWWYATHQSTHYAPPQPTVQIPATTSSIATAPSVANYVPGAQLFTAIPSSTCANFKSLSNFVLNNIASSDDQTVLHQGLGDITSFKWRRKQGEPYITYPTVNGINADYDQNTNLDTPASLVATVQNDWDAVNKILPSEAQKLNLSINALNTIKYQYFSDDDEYLGTVGLSDNNNGDLYSLIFTTDENFHQAPVDGSVTVTCGRDLSQFDAFYDALDLQVQSTAHNPYADDYVQISDVSHDDTVYAITGSNISIAAYYYFDGNAVKLVSPDISYPADCSVLEAQKVGLGMKCVDGDSPSFVSYIGSQSMSGLNSLDFIASTGQSAVSNPNVGSLVGFDVSINSTSDKTEVCSIDFGDGQLKKLFSGDGCVGNSTSSISHYYAAPGTYGVKVTGTWEDTDIQQQMTEVLATTTVTTVH